MPRKDTSPLLQAGKFPLSFEVDYVASCWHNIFFPEVNVPYFRKENNICVLLFQSVSFISEAQFLRETCLGRTLYLLTTIIFEKTLWEEVSLLSCKGHHSFILSSGSLETLLTGHSVTFRTFPWCRQVLCTLSDPVWAYLTGLPTLQPFQELKTSGLPQSWAVPGDEMENVLTPLYSPLMRVLHSTYHSSPQHQFCFLRFHVPKVNQGSKILCDNVVWPEMTSSEFWSCMLIWMKHMETLFHAILCPMCLHQVAVPPNTQELSWLSAPLWGIHISVRPWFHLTMTSEH